jgi:hypothetical protein
MNNTIWSPSPDDGSVSCVIRGRIDRGEKGEGEGGMLVRSGDLVPSLINLSSILTYHMKGRSRDAWNSSRLPNHGDDYCLLLPALLCCLLDR